MPSNELSLRPAVDPLNPEVPLRSELCSDSRPISELRPKAPWSLELPMDEDESLWAPELKATLSKPRSLPQRPCSELTYFISPEFCEEISLLLGFDVFPNATAGMAMALTRSKLEVILRRVVLILSASIGSGSSLPVHIASARRCASFRAKVWRNV